MKVILMLLTLTGLLLAGTVKGRVVYKGEPPQKKVIEVTTDALICGETVEVRLLERSPSGGVKNAVVWIEGAKGKLPQNRDVKISIRNCRVTPLVSVGFVGGSYIIRNEDPILHTIQLKLGLAYKKKRKTRPLETGATIYNLALPRKGMELRRPIKRYHRYQEKTGFIYVRSNAHPWIRGYIFVFDHPFADVTDGEGRFEIRGLPAGRYKLKVWQEAFGVKELEVEVKEDEVVELTVSLGG